ncbi:hypothetical protein ACSBR1_001473 [Camellia fascicularis]
MAHHSFSCVIINVYAPNEVLKRRHIWESLAKPKPSFSSPWCIVGDFNEIRFMSERKWCSRKERIMKDFNELIENQELIDIPMLDRTFT